VQVATEGGDALYGYSTDDTLSGLGGDDLLDGGEGKDTLDGGAVEGIVEAANGRSLEIGYGNGDRIYFTDGMELRLGTTRPLFAGKQTERRVSARNRRTGEGQYPRGQAIIRSVEVGHGDIQQDGQALREGERRRVRAALVAADAGARRCFVQPRQYAETVLRDTLGKPRLAQASAENRRGGLEGGCHPSIFVDSTCAVSTNAVECAVNDKYIVRRRRLA
jgi:hypothetical protein